MYMYYYHEMKKKTPPLTLVPIHHKKSVLTTLGCYYIEGKIHKRSIHKFSIHR